MLLKFCLKVLLTNYKSEVILRIDSLYIVLVAWVIITGNGHSHDSIDFYFVAPSCIMFGFLSSVLLCEHQVRDGDNYSIMMSTLFFSFVIHYNVEERPVGNGPKVVFHNEKQGHKYLAVVSLEQDLVLEGFEMISTS